MLSRTADSLYWMGRYMERADFTARILEAAIRLSSLPADDSSPGGEWDSAVAISDVAEPFLAAHGAATEANVCDYLAFNPDNLSSIRCCLGFARANARAMRTALTPEVWESINDAWNEFNRLDSDKMDVQSFSRFLEWLKGVVRAYDGAVHHTQLRNDGYAFMRLGAAVERADNTARILDVKYHLLLPDNEPVGGGLDYFQWSTILREVSALTSYRWVYRESIKPWLVADLLILNRQMPRSLLSCCDDIAHHLDRLASAYSRRGPAQRLATTSVGRLAGLRIEQIFQSGLHEFIIRFVMENARLSSVIAEQYLL